MPLISAFHGSVSDLVGVRGQLRTVLKAERKASLSESERASVESALADTERALATLARLSGVRYPP